MKFKIFSRTKIRYSICATAVLLLIIACSPFKKNNQYAKDFIDLNKNDFAKKYLSLYNNQIIDFSQIKENKGYLVYQNGNTFRIILFCSDGFTYTSSLMPLNMLNSKLPKQRLFRDHIFSIDKNIVKLETMNVNINSVIEEGIIEKDTIFMKKKYHSKNPKKIWTTTDKYILYEKAKIYKFSDDYFIMESD